MKISALRLKIAQDGYNIYFGPKHTLDLKYFIDFYSAMTQEIIQEEFDNLRE